MSGHSHAKTIAHQKSVTDQKRGQIFSKMGRLIAVAVKEGGANLEINSKLKAAIERAKSFNMPNDNIDRAVKQAIGGQEGAILSEFIFEAFGPGGSGWIIEGITDNRNRVLGEVKQILNQYNGKLAQEGSVKWLFDRKAIVSLLKSDQLGDLQSKENMEMSAIEAGAQDFSWQEESLEIYGSPESLQSMKKYLADKGLKIESASIDWVAKENITASETDKEKAEKLFSDLDDNSDVQDVYSNLED